MPHAEKRGAFTFLGHKSHYFQKLNQIFRALRQLRQQSRRVAYRHSYSITVVERLQRVSHGVEDVPLGAHTSSTPAEMLYQHSLHAVINLRLRQRRHLTRAKRPFRCISLYAQLHQSAEYLLHIRFIHQLLVEALNDVRPLLLHHSPCHLVNPSLHCGSPPVGSCQILLVHVEATISIIGNELLGIENRLISADMDIRTDADLYAVLRIADGNGGTKNPMCCLWERVRFARGQSYYRKDTS